MDIFRKKLNLPKISLFKIVFSLFILSFPLAEVFRVQFSNGVALSINDSLLFISIAFWLIAKLNGKNKIKSTFLTKPILIFFLICLISLLINFTSLTLNQLLISSSYLLRFIAYFLIYFIVVGFDSKFKKRISYLMLFSGFSVVLLGFIQYFFYPSLKNLYYLGWDEHLYRMFSSFLDPNFAGAFFAMFSIYAFSFIDKLNNKLVLRKNIIFGILSLLSLIAVYLTYSRSALIMLAVSVCVYAVLVKKKTILAFVLIMLIVFVFIAPKAFQTEGTNIFRTVSSMARLSSAQSALKVFEQNYIFGVGFNAYRFAQERLGFLGGNIWETTHSGAGTDNSFLFVLATTGIVGLIAYLYLLLKMGRLGYKNMRQNKLAVVFLSILIGLVVNSLFLNSLFYVFIIEWLFLLAALAED